MKKFLQISILVVLVLALVSSIFLAAAAKSTVMAGSICPNAGWNTRSISCSYGAAPALEGLAYRYPSGETPNAGWNT